MIDYAKLCRNIGRFGVCAFALGLLSIVHAADSRFDAFMGRVVGNSTTVGFGGGGTPLVTSSAGLGTPHGNMGLAQSGTGVTVQGNAKVPLGGTGKSVQALSKAPVTRAAFLRGLGAAASNPLVALGLAVSAPAIVDWLADGEVKINPIEADYPDKPFLLKSPTACDKECWTYNVPGYVTDREFDSKYQACAAVVARYPQTYTSFSVIVVDGGDYCQMFGKYYDKLLVARVRPRPSDGEVWVPASMSDIAPYMDPPSVAGPYLSPMTVKQGIQNGIDPFGGATPTVSVSGPDSVPGARTQVSQQVKLQPGTTTEISPGTSSDSQPGTKTSTKTETHKVNYTGPNVTYNTVTTNITTITNNVTGDTTNITGPTETTDNEAPEEKPDVCEKNPDSLMCQKPDLDVPVGEIPKVTRNVDYKPENLFGGGSCPADKTMTTHGMQLTVWDWQISCNYIRTGVYPVILILCGIGALLIVSGGVKQ